MTSPSLAVAEDRLGAQPALRIRGARKRYGHTQALDGVDFDVQAGEIHALVGENGAGKSTLINVLTGVVQADEGAVEVGGQTVEVPNPTRARALGIATVHQELTLLSNLTVAENLFLGLEPVRGGGVLDRRRMRERARELLAKLDVDIDPGQLTSRLEVADCQAVEICKALALDAKILVLDEPTAALAEHERHELFALLRSLAEQGLAIVYVSHHLSEVLHLARRVTVLRDGSRVFTRPAADLDEMAIITAMVGTEAGQLFPPRRELDPDAEVVLDASDVEFGRRVRGVDIRVRAGEIVGVTGLVGSGQQELGRLLVGALPPTGGRIDVRDRSRTALIPADRKGEGLALHRPARENLNLTVLNDVSRRLGLGRLVFPDRDRAAARDSAEQVRLRGDVESTTSWLSGGNQQKVLIGRVLRERPELLVLEEPTRGVDVGAKADLYRVLHDLAHAGTAIVLVSSDLREVAGMSHRVVVLDRGRIAGELPGEEASEDRILHLAQGDTVGGSRPGTPFGSGRAEVEAPQATGARRAPRTAPRGRRWRLPLGDATVPLAVLLAMFVVTALTSDVFLGVENLANLTRQAIVIALVGIGQLLVVLTAGVDLSIGAVVGLTNLASTEVLVANPSAWPLALFVVLALGAAVGAANGLLVRLGMPPLLATFAMLSILRGVIVWRYPRSIGPVPESFWVLDRHTIAGVPTAFLVTLALLAAIGWFLRSTRPGLHLFAVGRDARSAELSGVPSGRVLVSAYVLSGLLASLAGLFLTARVGAGLPNSGTGLELDAIAVVMIGGASLAGGRGSVLGTMAGVGIVTILANLMNLSRIDAFYQNLVTGVIIVGVAVVWAQFDRRRQRQDQLWA